MSKAPYGTWLSKIDASVIVSGVITFDDVVVDPITETIYHLEESPKDGRCIIVKSEGDQVVLPSPYSARTFVQEYGGAPAIVYNNIIYFSNDTGKAAQRDNKIYSLDLMAVGSKPTPITPENTLWRYANFAIHPTQTNLLVTLREDHTDDPDGTNPGGVVNTICVVDTLAKTPAVNVIVNGAGFYASPVLNPSGNKIAWQQWDLPDMPWQGGIVYVADVTVDSGSLTVSQNHVLVAGEKGIASATFPSWITDTTLAFTTDALNKFQNPFIFHTDTGSSTVVLKEPLTRDFAEPAWYLGLYPYAILGGGKYGIFTAFKDGGNIFYIIDLTAPSDPVLISPPKDSDYTVAQHVRRASDNTFVFTASNSSTPGGVIKGTVSRSPGSYIVDFTVLKASATDLHLERYISKPRPITLPMSGYSIYAVYYAPYNLDYSGPIDPNEKPPCIVGVHGGPTGLESQALNWTKMYYTSRGFAWLDVNYRGSSGYGRDYINLLNGNWGIYDVQDCKDAAKTLASDQYSLIDGNRVAIRGGSAGAYTTLASVTSAIDPNDPQPYYKTTCGAYGCVADVETLAGVTEKFEMDYINTLFGHPPGPVWDSRNPIKHAGNLSVPLLLLQGLADGVVPPSIVRGFLSAITQLVPSAELEFAFYKDEGHHFKKEDTIEDALRREHNWYVDTLLPFD